MTEFATQVLVLVFATSSEPQLSLKVRLVRHSPRLQVEPNAAVVLGFLLLLVAIARIESSPMARSVASILSLGFVSNVK